MSCPFMDPQMLARIPPEKKEELKEMYHRMKKEEVDHLKIDVKDEEMFNITPEKMMSEMTSQNSEQICPVMHTGGSSET